MAQLSPGFLLEGSRLGEPGGSSSAAPEAFVGSKDTS
jgi:hypothetical protein